MIGLSPHLGLRRAALCGGARGAAAAANSPSGPLLLHAHARLLLPPRQQQRPAPWRANRAVSGATSTTSGGGGGNSNGTAAASINPQQTQTTPSEQPAAAAAPAPATAGGAGALLQPIYIVLFASLFLGAMLVAAMSLQLTSDLNFADALARITRRIFRSIAFRQLVVIAVAIFLVRFALKLYYVMKEVRCKKTGWW